MISHENVAYSCVSGCLNRWVHAVCESLYTEDEVEQASDEGFACTYCAPYVPKPVGKCENKAKTPYNHINLSDFVYLLIYFFYFFTPLFLHSSRVSHYGIYKDQGAR